MLRLTLLPAPVHVAGLRVVHFVRVRWWRVARRRVRGCRVVVLDPAGRVLLIRHSYGLGHWMLPGGGLARGEDPCAGGVREVAEECGLAVHQATVLGRSDDASGLFETWVVGGRAQGTPMADGREVVEAGFFALSALPHPMGSRLAALLPGWVTAMTADRPAP